MLFIRDEIRVLHIPLSFDLTYHQGRIPENVLELDPQVDSIFETHDVCFILRHVVGTVET